jgi:hypothetical protein
MRTLAIVLAAIVVMQVPGWAKTKGGEPGGAGYVDTNRPKVGKDYYVVHEGQSNQCKVVTRGFGEAPPGAIGGAPYATKKYAMAALKTFPECSGGEADEATDTKKHKKK